MVSRKPLILITLTFLFFSPLLRRTEARQLERDIRLVVVVAVDQLRFDYLDRFRPVLEGGLAKLIREGVVFSNAHQDHAITSTGPGHASISTGRYPSHSGIVSNQWYDSNLGAESYCVEDAACPLLRVMPEGNNSAAGAGRSPKNLLVTGLSDWIKAGDKLSRSFAASRKDRAAILLGGKHPDAAFWYDSGTGSFISSTYYFDQMPEWVAHFDQRSIPSSYFGTAWKPLSVDTSGLELQKTDLGWFERRFPYAIGGPTLVPDSSYFTAFGGTPMMDDYLTEFVKRLIKEERLGQDSHIDFLGISYSALDSVGHAYGPHSPEALDTIVRLDRNLAGLFGYLDQQVGLEHVLIVLSADHGVLDLPEYRKSKGLPAGRLSDGDMICLQQKGKRFLEHFGPGDWFVSGYNLNYAMIGRQNVLRSEVEQVAAGLLEECQFIRKVWTRTELEKASADPFHRLYRNSYYPERSPDLQVQVEKYFLPARGFSTSHGSAYDYDTHVPMVFYFPGIKARRIEERTATVDIAPTVAGLLGIAVQEELDGQDRSDALVN